MTLFLCSMRILFVNNVYNRLSTGKIVADIHHSLISRGYDSYVCYARGPKVQEKHVFRFSWDFYARINTLRGRLTGVLYGGCFISTMRLIRFIKKTHPDVVNLHCINDSSVNIYRLLRFLSSASIKTVITLHAEFFYTGNCGHAYSCEKWKTGCFNCNQLHQLHSLFDNTRVSWNRMMEAISSFGTNDLVFTSVSPWLKSRAIQNPIIGKFKHFVTLNGVDVNAFTRQPYSLKDKSTIGLSNNHVIMYVTSSFPSVAKGGNFILQLAERLPNVSIIVLGEYSSTIKIPNNIIPIGRVLDRNCMAKYYSIADITIVVSKAETFSMPVAESLCCGTPVVGFKAGGPESICLKDYCVFVPYGDMDSLENAIRSTLKKDYDSTEIMHQAHNLYSKEQMAASYIGVYQEIVRNEIS